MIVTIITVALAAVIVFALTRAYGRQGTVKAALDSVLLLQAQVSTLKDNYAELQVKYAALVVKHDALQEIVTQAAPVRELSDWLKASMLELHRRRETEHQDNLIYLSRIEGSMSRVETNLHGLTKEGLK